MSATTSAATRAASRLTKRTPRSRPSRSGCIESRRREQLCPLGGAFYGETGHTEFDSFVRGRGLTPSFAYFNYYEQNLTGNSLVGTDKVVAGNLRHRSFAEGAVRRGRLRHHGNFHDHGRRPGSSTTAYRRSSERRPSFTGAKFLDDKVDNSEDGSVFKLNATYNFDDDHMVYATYSEASQRRQRRCARFDPAARVQVGHARQLRDRRQDRMDGPPDTPQRRGLHHGVE